MKTLTLFSITTLFLSLCACSTYNHSSDHQAYTKGTFVVPDKRSS